MLGKVCLPVGVYEVVIEGLKGLNLAFRPLIEIHGLNLSNVDA